MCSDFTSKTAQPPPLALTMGEPAGISSEITFKAWLAQKEVHTPERPVFFCVNDPAYLEKAAHALGAPVPISTIEKPADAANIFGSALPVLPLEQNITLPLHEVTAGKPTPKTAPAVIKSIEQATQLAISGHAAGIVTNPIQKKTLIDAGFEFPGHTEYLGALTSMIDLQAPLQRGPVMMLSGTELRVAPVTIHTPLKSVSEQLTPEALQKTIIVVAQALVRDFGIATPRIAVAGLNPHAGEEGALGMEEIEIIQPVIAKLRHQGMDIVGPLPADTMFHAEARAQYHAAITMYHDQGLIPIKALDFHGTINVTLGLPIVRTSPDHGTGLNIAGRNKARADSLIRAIQFAGHIAHQRQKFDATAKASDQNG